mmetsp:Transcript_41918/g.48249  ORF Transcript_41918/g.48249 Transcript_41918/m.48249 type:complete len:83 (-) Transcript_41918:33-281(-)
MSLLEVSKLFGGRWFSQTLELFLQKRTLKKQTKRELATGIHKMGESTNFIKKRINEGFQLSHRIDGEAVCNTAATRECVFSI